MEKTTKFNLSKFRQDTNKGTDFIRYAYAEEKVKEFIRLVKKSNIDNWKEGLEKMEEEIDKLGGKFFSSQA